LIPFLLILSGWLWWGRSRGLESLRAEKTQTKSVLFVASEVIEEFAGTFFFVLLLLTFASVILVIVYAIKNR
jgi:hypothetical protein